MKPKVLIVTTETPDILLSGLSFFNQIFWEELNRIDYPFKVLYINAQRTPKSALADYEIPVTAELPFDSSLEAERLNVAWSTSRKIEPILDEYKPDVISIHENTQLLPFYFHLRKVQFTLHSSYIGMQHYLSRTQNGLQHYWEQRIGVRQSGAVVIHSKWAHDTVLSHVSGDVVKPDVFPIGVRFSDYPREKISHPQGKVVISFFGRFTDTVKNFQVFRETIVTLSDHYRNMIEARVYGPEKIPPYLAKEGFKGLTYVQGEEKRKALSETDIVVFPSTQESFGIVGLEALLSNCALIATPGLGMDSYLQSENQCNPDVLSIQNKIIAYLNNIEKLKKQQKNNYFRKMVEAPDFNIETMVQRYITVWEELHNSIKR